MIPLKEFLILNNLVMEIRGIFINMKKICKVKIITNKEIVIAMQILANFKANFSNLVNNTINIIKIKI